MLPFLEHSKIDIACVGNHQFDLPLPRLALMLNKSGFPWLLSNLIDKISLQNFSQTKESVILEKNGFKIGFMGLAQKDWIDTLKDINCVYQDFIHCAKRLCKELKEKGCNFIIALTHMRLPNDQILADSVPQIDLILGGHDHCVHASCS